MSNRRRTQFGSAALTEATRRQLMQPVQCWERTVGPPKEAPSSTLRISKWVPTNKVQQFSDDEGEEEELELVPLPEEPDAGEDEMDQDETPANLNQPDAVALETPQISNPPSAPDSVTPPEPALVGDPTALSNVEPLPPLSSVPIEMDLELQPPSNLGPLDLEDLTVVQDNAPNGDGVHLELTGLGPDGTLPGDMTQIHEDDIVLGGPMMDHTGDPFAESKMAETLAPPE